MDSPDLDARLLIMAGTGLRQTDIILRGDNDLPDSMIAQIDAMADRRLAGEPIDHILGVREFYGRSFEISKDVLSPRPETEGLVDAALKSLNGVRAPYILDLGTGSGAIIITLLSEILGASGLAVDMSDAALTVAQTNARKHDVQDRLNFVSGSWLGPVEGVFDLIVSNPPYITEAAMKELSREVAEFDPHMALYGGPDGLGPYRVIIPEAKAYLKAGAELIFEIGYDQGAAVAALMTEHGYEGVQILKDLSGHDRVVTGKTAHEINKIKP